MRRPDDCVRLRHMLDAARKAIYYAHGHSLKDIAEDEPLNLILVRLLEIVGEAARNVSSETKAQYPQLPWVEMAATRNRLIHGYFDVDPEIIGRIVTEDLPGLVSALESILAEDTGTE